MAPPLSLENTPLALDALVDEAEDGLVVVGLDGRIERANRTAASLVGMTVEEIVGEHFDHFFGADVREKAADCFESAKRGLDVVEVTRLQAPGRLSGDVEVRARRLEDGRILAVLRDASDLRRHQRALQIVSAALSESPGRPFFEGVVLALVRALPIDYAFVGELVEPDRTQVRLDAFAGPDGLEAAVTYDLSDTPCQVALSERRSVFTSDVHRDFPRDAMLIELGVRTYHAIPLFDGEGSPLGILGILNREATAEDRLTTSMLDLVASRASAEISRQRTERDRRRAERHLRALVRASSRFVWGIDDQRRPMFDLERTWSDTTGQAIDPTAAPDTWLEAVVAEDRERVGAGWREAFEEEREFSLEYGVRGPAGVRHLRVRGLPIHGDEGVFEGFIGTIDDVTELHRAAEDLKRRNDMLRLLRAVPEATHNGAGFIESIQVGLAEVCGASRFELGRLRMQGRSGGAFEDTGLACGPFPARPHEAIASPLDADTELAERVTSSEVPVWVEECRLERRAGEGADPAEGSDGAERADRPEGGHPPEAEDRWSGSGAAVLVPVRFEGEPVAILELLSSQALARDETLTEVLSQIAIQLGRSYERDVNQRQMREAERRAHESQKLEAVGRLAGGIAHDFNNLLMVILGEAELALLSEGLPDGLRSALDEIRASGRRAASLTGQLLAFSRRDLESAQPVDLGLLIHHTERMLQRLIGEDVELDTSGLDGTAGHVVEVAPGLIEQVLVNLVVNAREAMPHGGTIRIGLTTEHLSEAEATALVGAHEGDYALLSVWDTGTGIPDDILENVFEPFFTTKQNGTGFGLSTSYAIVVGAGGRIDVRSEVGTGSEFRVFLPLADRDASREAPAGEPLAAPRAAGRVLIVEDDDAVRSVATRILSTAGYEVTATAGGAEVLEYVRSTAEAPDVLLTDCVLRSETGRDIDTMVRRAFPHVGTVFMSGYTDDVLLRQGVHPSGGAFLPKPFSPDALVAAVERVFTEASRHSRPVEDVDDTHTPTTAPPEDHS